VNRLIIRGGRVLVGAPIHGRVETVDVLVEGSRITAIAPDLEVPGCEEIDATGCFVLPGFVDTHHHLWQTTMRGVCADWNLTDYYWCIRRNHAVVHGPEDVYAGTYAGALAQLDAGTTCTIDFSHCLITPDHADEALRGLLDSGMRGVWCYGFYDPPVEAPVFADFAARAQDVRRVRSERFSSDDGLVRMGLALNELGLVPFSQTRDEVALSDELDLMLTMHTSAVWGTGFDEVEILRAAGLLRPGQVHSHCTACTDGHLGILRDHGASVSSTPSTELQMGQGFPIVARARDARLLPSLGIDIQSNNRADHFTEMRLALQAERARVLQPIVEEKGLAGIGKLPLTVREMLHYATLGGATALGLGDVCGSIDVGKEADVILLRHDGLHMRPVVDPIASIVLHAGPGDVDAVLVAGELVKRDGRLIHRDVGAAARTIDAAYGRVSDAVERRGGWTLEPPEGVIAMLQEAMRANVAEASGPVPGAA
jgi:5-methylthioadenosine/S-adenosylhomocysteine deaminase